MAWAGGFPGFLVLRQSRKTDGKLFCIGEPNSAKEPGFPQDWAERAFQGSMYLKWDPTDCPQPRILISLRSCLEIKREEDILVDRLDRLDRLALLFFRMFF